MRGYVIHLKCKEDLFIPAETYEERSDLIYDLNNTGPDSLIRAEDLDGQPIRFYPRDIWLIEESSDVYQAAEIRYPSLTVSEEST